MCPFLGIAQQPNDCVNAIVICSNGSFSSNASGAGVQEVSGCSSEEHNSIWIRVDVVKSGTLGFDLIPENTNLSVDYDFWVYGPNEDCSSLTTPIRCSTTNPIAAGQTNNHTGIGDAAMETFEGPGPDGDSYVEWIDVLDGESYYIVIDRPIGNAVEESICATNFLDSSTKTFISSMAILSPTSYFSCSITDVSIIIFFWSSL